ncbi:chloride channel protein [Amylibacter sp. SFDW26]|uniref:chloride channel protein n=1 Tax=Amylibacter sp. SFDW26 TaxID=2652722 RepID=UPI0012626222|nr:chloride channel protein [Amylibacter sp. SFDW26]KAB7610524.1 chloride channel protein [Amylibacter sp. SFDW26]
MLQTTVKSCLTSWSVMIHVIRTKGPGQLQFWLIALFIGLGAGLSTVLFRLGISELQAFIYGADDITLASTASRLPWYWILFIPVIGGLIVGAILHRYTPDGRGRSVAHVIQGVALDNGRVEGKSGLASALASLVTLSMGGSTGREGPVVHLGAVISSKISRLINADGVTGRNLMGCAAAAAVSASFNAPIAGTIFALEVVLRHYAIQAFAPIVIASVAGTIVSRLTFGNLTEFDLPTVSLQFYGELPAFLLLGLLCGLVAVAMMRAIFIAEDFGDKVQDKFNIPPLIRPAIAGFGLGAIAIWFPHIIGVGYETTFSALNGNITFWVAVVFVAVKVIAVALTFAGRMGGGVFSPSLMVGALTGLAFGWVASAIVPSAESYVILYALAGMAAVSAAVLGAPISTTLIVFEFTGDWQTGLAVMVAVSLSSALAGRLVHRSFFLTQLERAGVRIAAGPQEYLLATFNVAGLMQDMDDQVDYSKLISDGHYVDINATLEGAMPLFESSGSAYLPVVAGGIDKDDAGIMGVLYEVDALRAFNKALVKTVREEHD